MTDDRTIAERPSGLAAPLVQERFRFIERLGVGGMGEVIAARDEVLGREIAIKRMLEPAPTAQQIKRFLREAKIQGALDHSSIPPLHELAYDANGHPFFVMKRLIGTTLSEILSHREKRGFSREQLLRAFAEVCLAIEFAHVRGVVHRDLKPGNIMLGEFGEVFVLDWGVAQVVGAFDADLAAMRDVTLDDEAGVVIGTPAYMSPEQAANARLDSRSDVFALGRILDDILAAFDAPAPELHAIAESAAHADRETRLRTARELGERVQRYLDGDRDLALRRRLASEHLSRARSAIASPGSAGARSDADASRRSIDAGDEQRTAMQEAGRALALDPTLPGAAELVGRLMLEPPHTTPPEVEQSLADDRASLQKLQSRRGLLSYIGYAMLVPILLWFGVNEPAYVVVYAVAVAMLMWLAWYGTRHPIAIVGWPLRPVLVVVGNAIVLFIFSRMFSPFLIGPALACVIVTALLGHSAYRNRTIALVMLVTIVSAILVPWFLEQAGVLAPTFTVSDRWMLIDANFIKPATTKNGAMLGIYAVVVILITLTMNLSRTRSEDEAQRQLHLQAWRLRQLVPA